LVLALALLGIDAAADVRHRHVVVDHHRAGLLVDVHLGGAHRHLPERGAPTERRAAPAGGHDAAPDQLAAAHAEALLEEVRIRQAHTTGDRLPLVELDL